ncbi:MAG: glycosyltransferase [Gammaproteobacteria bacterium]
MRILHIVESSRGGCGTYLNEILPFQIRDFSAANIRLIAPDRHLAQLEDVLPFGIIRPFRRPTRAVGLAFLVVKLVTTVWAFRPTIIHAHSTFAGAAARLLAIVLSRKITVIYCPHGWVFDTARSSNARRAMQAAERFLSHWCAAIVCISGAEKLAGEGAGIPPRKLQVIANGLQILPATQTAAAWQDSRLKVLFVGRLDRQKGVDVLIEAVQSLAQRVSTRIVGESVLASGLPRRDSDSVQFMGWLDRTAVASQMSACDVVVVPSRWEGFGLVAIEAMRAGKAVVASAVGGMKEIVIDGVTGKLTPPDDSAALRDTLGQLDPAACARLGEAGRKRFVQFYSIDRTHALLKRLYDSVTQRGITA